jgi:hypothetical protein
VPLALFDLQTLRDVDLQRLVLQVNTADPWAPVLPPQLEQFRVALDIIPSPRQLLFLVYQMLTHPRSNAWDLFLARPAPVSPFAAVNLGQQQQQQEGEGEVEFPNRSVRKEQRLELSSHTFLQRLAKLILLCEKRTARAAAAAGPLAAAGPAFQLLVSMPAVHGCC